MGIKIVDGTKEVCEALEKNFTGLIRIASERIDRYILAKAIAERFQEQRYGRAYFYEGCGFQG